MSKNNDNTLSRTEHREKVIIKTSVVGICANVLLALFKATIGLISNSIAVVLDAVNNLSDALSSVITIVGTRLANKRPDKKHPLGHGRIEYLSAMIVSVLVLYAGITSLIESVRHIIHPQVPAYSMTSLIIIGVAVLVKIILGRYVKSKGDSVGSASLSASGQDALFDALLSASVLACAIVFVTTGLSLEAYVGIIISGFIIKAGIEMLLETVSDILGKRADAALTRQIKTLLAEEPEVRGAYDLIINNYGPDKNYASVHIELPDYMTVEEVDKLTRRVEAKVYNATGVVLTGVGVYSFNTSNDEAAVIRNKVLETVISHDFALQLHGFYVDIENKEMRFDVVFSFDVDIKESLCLLYDELAAIYPDYEIYISPDIDISD